MRQVGKIGQAREAVAREPNENNRVVNEICKKSMKSAVKLKTLKFISISLNNDVYSLSISQVLFLFKLIGLNAKERPT